MPLTLSALTLSALRPGPAPRPCAPARRLAPRTPRPLVAALALATLACLAPAPARAGYYAVTYTGSITGGPSYSPTGTPWPGSGSCNGSGTLTIQGTATWTHQYPQDTAPPPAGLLVEDSLTAAPTGNGPPGGTATASDGLGDGPGATATPVTRNGVVTGVTYGGSSGGHPLVRAAHDGGHRRPHVPDADGRRHPHRREQPAERGERLRLQRRRVPGLPRPGRGDTGQQRQP